jgi:hypothetical protein
MARMVRRECQIQSPLMYLPWAPRAESPPRRVIFIGSVAAIDHHHQVGRLLGAAIAANQRPAI